VQLRGSQHRLPDARDDEIQQRRARTGPFSQGRTIDVDALRSHHLGLTIQRQMMIEFGDDNVGDDPEARLAAPTPRAGQIAPRR
jgi:hypothetical protein